MIITLGKTNICLINCYLPSAKDAASLSIYNDGITLITTIIDRYQNYDIIVTGDFNADIFNRKQHKEKALLDFIKDAHLINHNTPYQDKITYLHKA